MQLWLMKGDVMNTRGIKEALSCALVFGLLLMMLVPPGLFAQDTGGKPTFKQEELDQMLAPIALYPDSLLTQILMASTYPLEVVQADRWTQQNKNMKGDELAKALEAQPWDPSVKSLVNFPSVLQMMSEKLDMTQKLGDAFLAQQKDVMDTIQKLRAKAVESGNLKTTQEQVVKVEKEIIIIESASPQVVYVPTYSSTVVYGVWAYPAYPPYPYYPPGYVATPYVGFATGVAVGVAWGYAWGHSDWHGGDIDIDVDRNTTINNNIDRSKYKQEFELNRGQRGEGQRGQGSWQHNSEHRKGVSYRDQGTAQKYNRASTNDAVKSRDAYRGRAEAGRQDLQRGGADQSRGQDMGQRGSGGRDAQQRDISSGRASSRDSSGQRSSAFSGMDSGRSSKQYSSRGSSSRQSSFSGGGGGRSGGGGGRGGGRR